MSLPLSTQPNLTVPEPLKGSETGSFAHRTIAVRLPEIGRRTIDENQFPQPVVDNLKILIEQLPFGAIRPLIDTSAPDSAGWRHYITSYLGMNWLEVPWFFAENYFYRRVLEATGYFEHGPMEGVDPYTYQKRAGLEAATEDIQSLGEQANDWSQKGKWDPDVFSRLLRLDLWGNQVDLSLWPAGHEDTQDYQDPRQAQSHLLVDDTSRLVNFLTANPLQNGRVDILVDNAGFELVCDLCLADFLLCSQAVSSIRFHLKSHPTFVSDAMIKDVHQALAFMEAYARSGVHEIAQRLIQANQDGRLQLVDSFFWNSPLALWELPDAMREEFSTSRLVISKGDANYRRALGDRHWPFTTPVDKIVNYFPSPLLFLRALKSEEIAGLQPGQSETLFETDPNWLVDGRWGVIQLWEGS